MVSALTFSRPSPTVTLHRRALLALPLALALPHAGAQAPNREPVREPIRVALIEGLSGPFANAGEAVFRNLLWAAERVNQRGGVPLPGGARPLALVRYDSKGTAEESLGLLRAALDQGIAFIAQGNSSASAGALIDALDKHNAREPRRRALLSELLGRGPGAHQRTLQPLALSL
jgi:branched-chain amino acid transport system substrate-binding protein